MQSPDDQRILAAQTPEGPARTLFSQAVPGGKALLRLLNFLQTRGLERHAAAAVDGAVPENLRAAFNARVEQIVSPAARSVTDGSIATTSEAADLENIARELIAAAQVTTLTGVGPSWRSMGPATIRNGQTYNTAIRMNVSGRVAAIAVDPHNPAHVLCGAANGGVWESFNRGGSWAPRTDFAATTAVGALTFSQANPSIVYCGTGEGNWWSWLGVGILRSNNGGASWSTLCTAPFVGKGFFDLRVDPANGNHLIAATTGGLYVSTDGGVTWTQPRSVQTWSIAFGAGEVLAASSDGIARSTDGGATWRAVPLPGSPGGFTRIAVSIAPSNPAVAYAWGASGSNGYLWRRAGGTWTPASSLPPGLDLSQAWYDWYAAAAPDRDNQVYLGAIEAYRGDFSGAVWNWTVLSNHSGGAFHPDQHAVAFEPGNPNTIYAGSDGGLFRSPDRGNTWVHCNNGLVISEFEYIAQNVGISRWLIGGTQDNGTDRWTGSSSFDHVADGDGGYVAVNHDDPRTVFHTFYGMSPEVSSSNGDWNTWTSVAPPTPQGEGSAFYPPMRCSDSNGATLAIAGGALYVSRANGASWVRLAFPGAASASAICVPNANNVYVGVSDGRLFHTSWNGAAWTPLAALTTPRVGANVSDLLVSASTLNRIWVTSTTLGGGRVYRSDDGGSHWIDRSPGLPNLPVTAIEVDSRNANRIWAAMDRGVAQSLDAGATWTDFSNGLPNSYVGDLSFHPHSWVLRAGTRNRGIWEIPVDGWMTAPVCGTLFTGTLNANQTARWFTSGWPATWHVIWTVMPVSPYATVPQITLTVQVERQNAEFVTYWLVVQNLTATTLSFEGRYCILSRY